MLVTESLAPAALDWLSARVRVARHAVDGPGFGAALAQADALVVRTYTIVDDDLLARGPRLRVVARAGVGLDNIDVAACERRGVRVLNTPDANTQAVVEYVLCLICDALRPRAALAGAVSTAEWNRLRGEVVGRRQMNECVLGVLGLGRVGSRVAEVGGAIGMRVLYNDLREIPASERHGAEEVSPGQLFAESDIVTVHVDGRASNRGLLGAALLDTLKADSLFINTSRGFVVDHRALAGFLRRNPAATAMLDVHEPEPIRADNPLLAIPNAHLFPHLASRTETAMDNMSWVVRDVVAELERERM